MFDFSDYSIKSKYYDNSNILVIGKMKDETGGVAIEEIVGLKPKIYSLLVGNSELKKATIICLLQCDLLCCLILAYKRLLVSGIMNFISFCEYFQDFVAIDSSFALL